jgi:hypothetical protein
MYYTGACKVVRHTHTSTCMHTHTIIHLQIDDHAVNIILYASFVSLPAWFVDNAILFLYILPYCYGFIYSEISHDQMLCSISFRVCAHLFVNRLATGTVSFAFRLDFVCAFKHLTHLIYVYAYV